MVAARVLTASVLARPGHALEQDVAVGEQADQQPLEQDILADDHPLRLGQHRRTPSLSAVMSSARAAAEPAVNGASSDDIASLIGQVLATDRGQEGKGLGPCGARGFSRPSAGSLRPAR